MVTVTNYVEREKDGKKFYALMVSGGIESILSEQTGKYYLTSRNASVTSTFDEETCKRLLGKQLPGRVVKTKCDPYDFVVKETGEVLQLQHRWSYDPNESSSMEETIFQGEIKAAADPFSF